MLQALIFDVDGTLADTETAHLDAFNAAFAAQGMAVRWDRTRYRHLLRVAGGKERLLADWQAREPEAVAHDPQGVRDAIQVLHALKTQAYEQAVYEGAVPMRPGVMALIHAAVAEDLPLAIATTTSTANIEALMTVAMGSDWRRVFRVVEDAASAARKKPHPMVYQQALARLDLPPSHCIALEDSANGLQAALAAGLPTVITPNVWTDDHDFQGALKVCPDLQGVDVATLTAWLAAA